MGLAAGSGRGPQGAPTTEEPSNVHTMEDFCGLFLHLFLFLPAAWRSLTLETENADGYRLSGPVLHGNLAIYFVHGKSRSGPVPLTLQEAMAKKIVEVREIGRVNEVQVENRRRRGGLHPGG